MTGTSDRIIYWLPRALGILFAVFLSLFALDVFQTGYDAIQIAIALVIHLLPALAVLILHALAWRWEGLGGVGFTVLGLLYAVSPGGGFMGSLRC